MKKKYVIANWKMNGNMALVENWVPKVAKMAGTDVHLVVCPPFVYLSQVSEVAKNTNLALGAQTVSAQAQGAVTGQVSAKMLKEYDTKYVIVGHSERRL